MTDDPGLFFGPCLNPGGGGQEWTDEQLERFKAEWERKRHGHPKVLGLPRRVRLRLAATRAVDTVAIWLVDRGRYEDAAALWWLTGGWW